MIYRSLELNSVTNTIFNFQSQVGAIPVFRCKLSIEMHVHQPKVGNTFDLVIYESEQVADWNLNFISQFEKPAVLKYRKM